MERALIYMDNCCFNRPFDDLSDDKVRLESEAVLTIVHHCEQGIWDCCGSDVLYDEIDRMDDPVKKDKVLNLYNFTAVNVEMNEYVIERVNKLITANIKPFDAFHIACAESANADVLLTTDKKLINASKRTEMYVRIENPVIWLMEVLYND